MIFSWTKISKTAEKDCIKMHNESEILDINRKTGLKILKFRKK